jgi:DNA repair protein RadC
MQATLSELLEIKGIGLTKAIQLKAALHLGVRASRQQIKPRYLIEHSSHAYQLVKDILENEKREVFTAIFLDTKGFLITHEVISIGSLSQTLVHPREVFYSAIRHKAASLIVSHNHPSGDSTPSSQDLKLTQTLLEASRLLGIPLKDHLIIGKNTYLSFKDQGLLN